MTLLPTVPFRVLICAMAAALLSQFGPSIAGGLADGAGLTTLSAQLHAAGTAQAAFIRRGKIKKRVTHSYRVVVVVGDDAETNEVETVEVALQAKEGSPEPDQKAFTLPLKVVKDNGNKRFVFNDLDFSADAVNLSYVMTSTMRGADGRVIGEPLTQTIEVEEDGDSRVRAVRIRQVDESSFSLKVVVVGDWDQEVARVDVSFSDYSGAAPIPEEISLGSAVSEGGKRTFSDRVLTFDDPAGAVDEVYGLVVDLIGHDGKSLGSSEFSTVVDGGTFTQIRDLETQLEAALETQSLLTGALSEVAALATELRTSAEQEPDAPIAAFEPVFTAIIDVSYAVIDLSEPDGDEPPPCDSGAATSGQPCF